MQVEGISFSIAANVCAAESKMILHTVPNWLRIFGARLTEVLLVVDEEAPSGRIASQHKLLYAKHQLDVAIGELETTDARVRHVMLDYSAVQRTSQRWFAERNVIRCQSGTPIFAFVRAIEEVSSDIVLRTDCDMLFFDAGWLYHAVHLLDSETVDFVEPPKLGMNQHGYQTTISTRAFMLKKSSFLMKCLPLKAHKLRWLRRLHRALNGRPPWLSLEESLTKEKQRGRFKHLLLGADEGFSVHVYNREYAHLDQMKTAVSAIEAGSVPEAQVSEGWNLVLELWPSTLAAAVTPLTIVS
jgi:hypothetical protein